MATLIDLILEQAERTPDAVAVVASRETLTYAELGARADELAARLRAQGVRPETVVALCAERGAAMIVGLLAVFKAGGAYLPLDPEYPGDRLSYMLSDAAADVVLVHEPTRERVAALGGRSAIDIDAFGPAEAGLGRTEVSLDPANLAYVIYTSGSTGRPKGACLSHRGVVNRLRWMQQAYPIGPGDAVLQKTPFSFDVSVWELFWPLMTGARLVMARPGGHRDPAYLAATIREHDVSVVHFVPSMLAQFLREPSARGLTSLRHVICSGEILPADVAERAMALLPGTLENLYGPTEASVDVSAYRCRPDPGATSVPIGRPITGTQLYVLTEDLRQAPPGGAGELYIGGVQVARGYHRRPGLTAARFIADPSGSGQRLYRTGDIARWRADGELEYLGRADNQVKINGIRVELDEIAVALRAHPGLRDAVVIPRVGSTGTVGTTGSQQLVAYVVAEGGPPPGPGRCPHPAELRQFLARTLPVHMLPAVFMPLAEIPLSPNGKIDRKQLPASASASAPAPPTPSAADPDAADGSILAAVCRIWAEVLGLPAVLPEDNFLELGGDSIRAIEVVSECRQLGLSVTSRGILLAEDVADLVESVQPNEPRSVR